MASWMTEYFGANLLTKDGLMPTSAVLAGKTRIGLYFSAHWCPPCRGFTPVLAEFYETLKESDESALEIVFISSDSDEPSFLDYHHGMPWVALPYSERSVSQALGQKFGVRGIPSFVILDAADASIKDKDARTTVANARGDISKATPKWA